MTPMERVRRYMGARLVSAAIVCALLVPPGLARAYSQRARDRRHEVTAQNAAACAAIRTVNARIDAILQQSEAASLSDPRVKGDPTLEAAVRGFYAGLPPAKNC